MSEGLKRRDFLKVVGASSAGATLFGCSTGEVEKIIPYVTPPEEITPGVATWYATVDTDTGQGIWVRTREGRAVKVEGNPNHPVNRGGLTAQGHAALQGLYNPDRYASPMLRENGSLRPISWEEAERLLAERLGAASNPILVSGRMGPSLAEAADGLMAAAGGRRVRYDALSEAPLAEASALVFGTAGVPTFSLGSASNIVSFGADFLDGWISPAEHGRDFAAASGVGEGGTKARLIFVGARLPLTGLNADEWIPVAPGSEAALALAAAHVLVRAGADPGPWRSVIEGHSPESVASALGIEVSVIEGIAAALSGGSSVALPPGYAGQHRNSTAANAAVLVLNAIAGNLGRTVQVGVPDLEAPIAPWSALRDAITEMESGSCGVVLIHGSNPVFSLPAGSGFAAALAKVPFKVSFASAPDETSALADLILPDLHFLESWGDSNPRPGVYAVQQPVMRPVPHFSARSAGDVFLSAARALNSDPGAVSFRDLVRNRWSLLHAAVGTGGDFEEFWRETLRSGVAVLGAEGAGSTALQAPDARLSFEAPSFDGSGLFLQVHPSGRFGDGSFANRPWLLELPDPVSKITWHSWLEMHPDAADERGLRNGDVVVVRSAAGSLEVPVWTYPGIRPDTVALQLGMGHEDFGRFATGNGVNATRLLPVETEAVSGAFVYQATRVEVEPTGMRRRHATIEGSADHRDRPIVPVIALADLGHHGDDSHGGHGGGHGLKELQGMGGFAPVATEGLPQDYPLEGARYGEYDPEINARWAMAIDLDKCTGCSACIVACQSENNVPWVGEDNVRMGRDMAWIRVERYWDSLDATHAGPVDVRFLPMMCQHCGNAPCEPVCPVYAAYHTPEGLNGQVYNRCVGTRYCANNCPYKVRVFNWYTFTDVPEPMNWAYNPDVTVRDNGVMEKCSFCVQRIREAENRAALEGRRPLRDGEVVSACQQSCPAEAIVFGNIRDPNSRVAQLAANERTYRVLDALINTQPAVNYMKKVTFHSVGEAH